MPLFNGGKAQTIISRERDKKDVKCNVLNDIEGVSIFAAVASMTQVTTQD